jgi:Ni/Co efflux regulator RcnB
VHESGFEKIDIQFSSSQRSDSFARFPPVPGTGLAEPGFSRGEGRSMRRIAMNKFMLSAAAIALCLGTASAYAQEDQTTTTTSVQNPDGSTDVTQKTTTTSTDGFATYRKTVTSKHRYNAAAFVAPSGYTYRRFSVGEHVPSLLLSDSVVLSDYQNYALETPPSGLTWIRDGQDALLVDMRTGEVIQADYDVFNG